MNPRHLWLWMLLPLLAACSQPPEIPEQRIRELIGQGEAAAEARDRGFFDELVADGYSDRDGHTRRDLLRLLTGWFLRNRSIHLMVRIEQIELLDAGQARATLYAGMAGSPVVGFEQLLALRAALYRMELTFQLGDEIKLLHAQWRQANPEEVLPSL